MNIYKSSVFALTLSIVSLSGAMTYQSYMQSRVLGITTNSVGYSGGVGSSVPVPVPTTPTYPTPTLVPPQNGMCGELLTLTQKYCRVVTPTLTPAPTTTTCKSGVSSFSIGVSTGCAVNTFSTARYVCYDGTYGTLSPGSCVTSVYLQKMATLACEGHSSCAIKPTAIPTKRLIQL